MLYGREKANKITNHTNHSLAINNSSKCYTALLIYPSDCLSVPQHSSDSLVSHIYLPAPAYLPPHYHHTFLMTFPLVHPPALSHCPSYMPYLLICLPVYCRPSSPQYRRGCWSTLLVSTLLFHWTLCIISLL